MLVAAGLTASTAALFALRSPGGGGETASLRLDGVLSAPGMRPVMALGLLYAFALSATLTYIVPAARELDITAAQAGVLFAVVNVSAAAARLVWGRLADRHGGTRRARTLAETGALAAGAALLMPLALRAGVVPAVVVACALSFGAFGFNGVLYVTAGEIAGAERAGRAVGVASTVVFACTSALTPVAGLVAETFGLTKPPRISRREADVVIPESLLSFMRESRRLSNRRMRQELRVRLRYPLVADGLAEAAAQHRVRANTSAASKSAQAVQSYSQ